jgi:hypothetical protein
MKTNIEGSFDNLHMYYILANFQNVSSHAKREQLIFKLKIKLKTNLKFGIFLIPTQHGLHHLFS